jgi:hypothetical protein
MHGKDSRDGDLDAGDNMVERNTTSSFMLIFRMDQRVERVITPIHAAQAETVRRKVNAPPIEFDCMAMWDTWEKHLRCFSLGVFAARKLHAID